MSQSIASRERAVAGVVRARCSCCPEPEPLVPHLSLGGTRLACPKTRQTYLDRGDGLYAQDGERLGGERAEAGPRVDTGDDPSRAGDHGEPDVLGDRPVRTGPKTRIDLARATFAGGR